MKPRLRRAALGLCALAIVGVLLALAWRSWRPAAAAVSAEELVLARQTRELQMLVAAAERGALLDFQHVLVVVDQLLVQDLLRATLPAEGLVSGVQVRLESVEASFGDGLALVRLNGKASWAEQAATADLQVFGGLEVAGLEPSSGSLLCRVKVFGVVAKRASFLGLDEPLRSLTEALTHGGLEAVLQAVEIPVRVEDHLSLPAVSTKRVRIAALELPIKAEVAEVRVFGGKLWVALALSMPEPGPAGAPGPAGS